MKVKGKLQDFLQLMQRVIVFTKGGDNAGHAIVIDGRNLSALDSFRYFLPKKRKNLCNLLANGMVVNPKSLIRKKIGGSYLLKKVLQRDNLRILPDRVLSCLIN